MNEPAISFSSYSDSACSISLLCCVATYLDIRFPFCFLFELSTFEDHQDKGRGEETYQKENRLFLGNAVVASLRNEKSNLISECI